MDAGIVDAINRRDVKLIVARLDALDLPQYSRSVGDRRWYEAPFAETLMGESADRAWLVSSLAACVPGLGPNWGPADCDWENLFSHFRAEILARRDPETPPAKAA